MKPMENWKGDLPGRLTFAIVICESSDATQLYTKEMHRKMQINKITGKDKLIYVYEYQDIWPNQKELETLLKSITIYSQNIRMGFEIKKRTTNKMKKEKEKE